jgi:hypothetical protein
VQTPVQPEARLTLRKFENGENMMKSTWHHPRIYFRYNTTQNPETH